jgi:hypothetical protein
MTVRSGILSSGIISTAGYSSLLQSPANETCLVKGFYGTSAYNGTNHLSLYLWGPAGGAGLSIYLGSVDLAYLQPYALTLWIPLNPGFRIGCAIAQQPLHFALTGAMLYGVAAVPPDVFPDSIGPDPKAIFTTPQTTPH